MVTQDRNSLVKAFAFIAGGLGFFLVIMHQAAQFFR